MSPNEHLRKDERVLDELLADGSMVLFHGASRKLVTLNSTAALVWEYCDGAHTEAEIVDEVRMVFPHITTIARDVTAVLADLRAERMLAIPDAPTA